MVRFSQRAVPVGQVPSTGKADTGNRSPLPASMTAVTRLTKSGASSATTGGRLNLAEMRLRHLHLVEMCQGVIDRGEIAPHHFLSLLAVGLLNRLLDLVDRFLVEATRPTQQRNRSA